MFQKLNGSLLSSNIKNNLKIETENIGIESVLENESKSEPVSMLVSEPVSESVSEPVSIPASTPESEPVSASVSEPVSASVSEPVSASVSESVSVSEPASTPESEPISEIPQVDDTVKLLIDETNNTQNEDINNIVNLLLKIINDEETLKNLSIEIDVKTKDILSSLLSSNPKLFIDIETCFFNIVKDNSINLNDIPCVLDLLKKIYEILHNLKNKKLSTNDIADIASKILKIIINVLVDKNKLNLDQLEQEFMKNINNLIDSSASLIKLTELLKPEIKNCFFNIFKI